MFGEPGRHLGGQDRSLQTNGAQKQERASHASWMRCPLERCCRKLRLGHVLGRWPFVALLHFKIHPVTFSECLESGHVDRGVVNKYISTAVLLNETEPFPFVEPLYRPTYHSDGLLQKFLQRSKISGHHIGKGLILWFNTDLRIQLDLKLMKLNPPRLLCHALNKKKTAVVPIPSSLPAK